MEPWIIAWIAVVVIWIVVQVMIGRRVRAGDGRFVWVTQLPRALPGIALLIGGASVVSHQPLVGAILATIGLGYLVIGVRFLRRIARATSKASTPDAIADAVIEPTVDQITTMVGIWLILGLVVVVVLIGWGISQAIQ